MKNALLLLLAQLSILNVVLAQQGVVIGDANANPNATLDVRGDIIIGEALPNTTQTNFLMRDPATGLVQTLDLPLTNGALTWNGTNWELSTTPGVVFTEGGGISIVGTTISNTAPDIPVVLDGINGISVTGSYPNFTIENTGITSIDVDAPIVGDGSALNPLDLIDGNNDGEVLTWVDATSTWQPLAPIASGATYTGLGAVVVNNMTDEISLNTGDVTSTSDAVILSPTAIGAAVGAGFSIDVTINGLNQDGVIPGPNGPMMGDMMWATNASGVPDWRLIPSASGTVTEVIGANGIEITNGLGPIVTVGLPTTGNPDDVLTWDGTTWVPQVNQGWQIDGNAGTNPSTNFVGTSDNNGLAFRTNNTEAMRINTDQNIGIGTTTPTNAKLEIVHAVLGGTNSSGLESVTTTTNGLQTVQSTARLGRVGTASQIAVQGDMQLSQTSTPQFTGGFGVGGSVSHPTGGTIQLTGLDARIGATSGTLANAFSVNVTERQSVAAIMGLTGMHNIGGGSVTGTGRVYTALFQGNGRVMGLRGENSAFMEFLPEHQQGNYHTGVVGFYNTGANGGNNGGDTGTPTTYFSIEANVVNTVNDDIVMQFHTTAGNVGIGESAPAQKLHLTGGRLRIENGGDFYDLPAIDGTNGQVMVTDGAGDVSWQTISAGGADNWGTDVVNHAPGSPISGEGTTIDRLTMAGGISGQVLTSNGAGAEPTWETATSAAPQYWFTKLNAIYSNTVSTVQDLGATLLTQNFTPVGDTVLVSFTMSGGISAASGMAANINQQWGFRIRINGSNYETTFGQTHENTGLGRVSASFTLPVPVNPGVSNTIVIQALEFGTLGGSITLEIDPSSNFEHAYLTIQDVP